MIRGEIGPGWLVAGAILLIAASPPSHPSSAPKPCASASSRSASNAEWWTMMKASHQNGYQDGFIAGQESVTPMPPMVLDHLYARDQKAREYEKCLGDLRFAVSRNELYLRTVANQCVSLLPYGA